MNTVNSYHKIYLLITNIGSAQRIIASIRRILPDYITLIKTPIMSNVTGHVVKR